MPLSDLASALAAATGPSRALDGRLHQMFRPDDDILTDPGDLRERRPPSYDKLRDVDFTSWSAEEAAGLADHIGAPLYTSSLDAITAALDVRWPGLTTAVFRGGFGWVASAHDFHCERMEDDVYPPTLKFCLAAVRLAMAPD